MKRTLSFPLLVVAALTSSHAMAAARHAVKTLPGYSCAMLNLTHEQEMDFNHPPMLYSEPRDGAQTMGGAAEVLAVKSDTAPVNGYIPALQMNMKSGWVKQALIKPYAAAADPTARCEPVLMSDGTQGFSYHHD